MKVEATLIIPDFLSETLAAVEESIREDFINITSKITYLYSRFQGKRDEKIYLPSTVLQRTAPNYRRILNILIEAGFFNYQSNYRPPAGGQMGYCRFFLMGNKFLADLRRGKFIKFKRFITIRNTVKAPTAVQERIQESNYLDELCQHVQKSLDEFEIAAADISTYQGKSWEAVARAIQTVASGCGKCSRSKGVGKIINSMQQVPAQFRRGKLRGETAVELDLKSSHVFQLLEHGFLDGSESQDFKKLLAGDFWNDLRKRLPGMESVSRGEFKILFWQALSSRGGFNPVVRLLKASIRAEFPGLVKSIARAEKATGKTIQAILQGHEAGLIDRFVTACIKNDIPVIPIYDSVIVRKSDAEFTRQFFGADRIALK